MSSTKAIVTLVTSEDFVIGAQVMVHSLLTSNPDIKQLNTNDNEIVIAVMVTNNISDYSRRLLLSSGFDTIIEIDQIPNPNKSSSVHVSSWIEVGFTKLRIWSFTQFTKILYIDADCIVINDIQHLLTDNTYNDIIFAASPDVFPPDNFNGGVMLIKPDINTMHILLNEMAAIESYDGGDTGFLNQCSLFKDWYQNNTNMMRLEFGYNAQRIMHWFTKKKPEYWTSIESKLKIIHYSSSPKPWNLKPSQRMVDRLEVIWHKNWISLNEKLNKMNNKKVALNESNNIRWKSDVIEQKMDYKFDVKLFEQNDFDQLMTNRPIQFGRVYDGDDAVEYEKRFLMKCSKRFNEFISTLNKLHQVKAKESEFIFDGIPKIIHQIWVGPNEIPQQYEVWSKTWNALHPNWKFMLWTDETLKQQAFEWKSPINKSLYQIAQNYGEKSDILRLEILYEYGGIYVDFDFECIQTLNAFHYKYQKDELRKNADNDDDKNDAEMDDHHSVSCILGFSNTGLLEVNNAMIGCAPKHEILPEIWKSIQLICNDRNGEKNEQNTIIRTGPVQLTRCIMRVYEKYNDILVFPTRCFYPFPNNMRYLPIMDRFVYYNHLTFAVHHWGVSWNKSLKNNVTTNEGTNGIQQIKKESVEEKDDEDKNGDDKENIIDSIMNTSNNIALQSRIMSFLQ